MKHAQNTHQSEHQEISLLLPWYVNNTLENEECNRVETHLKSCLVCRIELVNLQKLSVFVNQEDDVDTAVQAAFSQLKNRIHENQVTTKQETGFFDALAGFFNQLVALFNAKNIFRRNPGFVLATVFSCAFSLILLDHFSVMRMFDNDFQTLSSNQKVVTGKNEIRLVFAKNLSEQQIKRIVASIDGKIVAGPTAQGVYRVRIGLENVEMTRAEISKIVSSLREHPQIIFAEPTYALISQNNQSPG